MLQNVMCTSAWNALYHEVLVAEIIGKLAKILLMKCEHYDSYRVVAKGDLFLPPIEPCYYY